MSDSIERAILLIDNKRHAEAERLLRAAIGEDPSEADAYALLAEALAAQDRLEESVDAARQAVGLAPEEASCQVVLAEKLGQLDQYAEAQTAVDAALRLDPESTGALVLSAMLHFQRREFDEALELTDEALRLDPEDASALQLQTMITVGSRSGEEALEAADHALEQDPGSEVSHLTRGLALMDHDRFDEAAEHFKEALRLDPTLDVARECLTETIKARNPIYRFYWKWSSFTERLSRRQIWFLIIGSYVFIRLLRGYARENPEWAPYVMPIILGYVGLVLLSWTSEPIFNSLLRLDKNARWLLTARQVTASNGFLGFLAAGAVIFTIGRFAELHGLQIGGVLAAALSIPVASTVGMESPRPRKRLQWILLVLFTLAVGATVVSLAGQEDLAAAGLGLFALGYLGFMIYAAKLSVDFTS